MTKNITVKRSFSGENKMNCRCSICGTIIKTPQERLTIDAKQYCAVCYQDNFFANARSSHRLTLDRCDG